MSWDPHERCLNEEGTEPEIAPSSLKVRAKLTRFSGHLCRQTGSTSVLRGQARPLGREGYRRRRDHVPVPRGAIFGHVTNAQCLCRQKSKGPHPLS